MTVAIQGVGHVGAFLADTLHAAGAKLVIADVGRPPPCARWAERTGAQVVAPEVILDAPGRRLRGPAPWAARSPWARLTACEARWSPGGAQQPAGHARGGERRCSPGASSTRRTTSSTAAASSTWAGEIRALDAGEAFDPALGRRQAPPADGPPWPTSSTAPPPSAAPPHEIAGEIAPRPDRRGGVTLRVVRAGEAHLERWGAAARGAVARRSGSPRTGPRSPGSWRKRVSASPASWRSTPKARRASPKRPSASTTSTAATPLRWPSWRGVLRRPGASATRRGARPLRVGRRLGRGPPAARSSRPTPTSPTRVPTPCTARWASRRPSAWSSTAGRSSQPDPPRFDRATSQRAAGPPVCAGGDQARSVRHHDPRRGLGAGAVVQPRQHRRGYVPSWLWPRRCRGAAATAGAPVVAARAQGPCRWAPRRGTVRPARPPPPRAPPWPKMGMGRARGGVGEVAHVSRPRPGSGWRSSRTWPPPRRTSISATSCGVETITAPIERHLLRQGQLHVAGARGACRRPARPAARPATPQRTSFQQLAPRRRRAMGPRQIIGAPSSTMKPMEATATAPGVQGAGCASPRRRRACSRRGRTCAGAEGPVGRRRPSRPVASPPAGRRRRRGSPPGSTCRRRPLPDATATTLPTCAGALAGAPACRAALRALGGRGGSGPRRRRAGRHPAAPAPRR